MLLFPGDRIVLRRPSPVNTFAGGQVLDAHLRRWRRRDSGALDQLPGVERREWPRLLLSWIDAEGLAGLPLPIISGRLGVFDEAVEAPLGKLLGDRVIRALPVQPVRFVTFEAVDRLAEEAGPSLERRLADEEVSAGIPARDFVGRLLPHRARNLADVYLEELRARAVIEFADGRVVPPGQDSHMTAAGEELTRRVESLYRESGFDAPSPREAAERLSARPASVEGICTFLVQRRRLVRLDGKYLVHRTALDTVARGVREWEVDDFAVGDFKDRFGLTRKLAIPALEWLDSERITVRQGDRRRILRRPSRS
jgi:selenocysteine-specific elongation factor